MYPYHIEIKNEVDLYQLNDGRFQLINPGEISQIMSGYKYLLVENELADYLKSLEIDRVTFEPATVWDRRNDKEYRNYQKVIVNHHFTSSDINDIDLSGRQLLLMDNKYLFASPELKKVLQESPFSISFSKGLSNFAEQN